MKHLPIFMHLENRTCLVVGGGTVALRKIDLLLKAGARVRVVAPRLGTGVAELAANGRVTHYPGVFTTQHLDNCALVVAATDSPLVNRWVYQKACERGLPVNVVDEPGLCSFIFPAIVDRAPVTIAISSGGAAPVLTRILRNRLESSIPAAYGRLAELVGRYRAAVKRRFGTIRARRLFWEQTLEGHVAEAALAGHWHEAERMLKHQIEAGNGDSGGEVYLIGAGPGDPDLLTFKALRLLQKADVVVYDRLVPEAIVDLARREAERVYVGKRRNDHSLPQSDISQLLADLATQGKKVARLKGGDPFVFGRGGEEITLLAEQGIPFQVVPGITAATGCAAYSGIPLTHRDYAQSVRFVTGHTRNGRLDLDWAQLARERQTLVFYMGLTNLNEICAKLVEHGLRADLPAALVEQGTTPNHRVYVGSLSDLYEKVKHLGVASPSLLIVGEVVRLHESLHWFSGEEGGAEVFPPQCHRRDRVTDRSEVA
ncbi:MAG: siroheme synthase CysG [Gammaproteobacteria bacterium]|jgi:uroporphyrin-III C-methyltransferase/precorrin-2 dehydrogenase/sirohydrochlorin ferrochelatase